MGRKVLYVASTFGHLKNFHFPYIEFLNNQGVQVDVAAKGDGSLWSFCNRVIAFELDKKMISYKNLIECISLAKIINQTNYDYILVHTTLAAFYVRLAVFLSNKRPIVVNTVHGYLFDEETPIIKKTVLLATEKIFSSITNVIITMNQTDYDIAKKFKLFNDKLYMIHGMGIVPKQTVRPHFVNRESMGLTESDYVLLCVAEFSKRKNQNMLIRSLSQLPQQVKIVFLGDGDLLEECKTNARDNGLIERVHFMGHVVNPEEYYQIADACVSASRIEGLPFNIMEAMYYKLPIIATRIKGHIDLIDSGRNGLLFTYNSKAEFVKCVNSLIANTDKYHNDNKSGVEKYMLENVMPNIISIYCDIGIIQKCC